MNDTVTTAVPGSAPRIRNLPSESVIAPSVVPSMATVAPTIGALDTSTTVPRTTAEAAWASARAGKESMLSMKKNDVSRVMS